MKRKPVLVVMAAGMGSRYGGLKQIDPVGSHGEAILDYSLYDAYRAGFETAVIIIKEAIREDFMAIVGKRLEKCPLQIRYAYQELTMIPEGFSVPDGRAKPWGTTHAVMCAADVIGDVPCAVINSDDYYGADSFRQMYDFLIHVQDDVRYNYCMVGYRLGNTVTDNGSVSRGVCQTNGNGYLSAVVERTRIEKYEGGIHFTVDEGATWEDLSPDTLVSMNMWGFTPSFLREIKERFPTFLEEEVPANPLKAEMFLPMTVGQMLGEGIITVKVLPTTAMWYGVTYAADKPVVVNALQKMTRQGLYPDGLWG